MGRAAGQPVGERGGAVAGVEDEQRHRPAGGQAAQHALDLGDRLRGPRRRHGPPDVDDRCPGGAQVPGDGGELVLPAGRGLAGALAVAGPVVDVLAARRAPRVRPGIGRRVDRDPRPAPAGARVPDPGGVRRRHPGQRPAQQPAVDDVVLRDPGPGLRPVHQRRQHLREQGEQPLVIDPPGRQRIVERAVARGGTPAPATAAPATAPGGPSTKRRPPARTARRPAPSGTRAAAPGTPAAPPSAGLPEGLAARRQDMAR